jgi:hypothetical protein
MKKILLALLISHSASALEPMIDEELGQVDGQAGITIESERLGTSTIGEIAYTDNDGNGTTHTNSAGIYLSDISFGPSSMTMTIDVENDGTLNINVTDITQGDLWVRDLAMGAENSSFGALGVTNFNYDPLGSYNIQVTSDDYNGDGVNQAGIVFNLNMRNSSFDVTFIEEAEFDQATGAAISGNTVSFTNQFTNFVAAGTTVYADDTVSDDGSEWIRVDLGSISGSAEFQNISLGSVDAMNSTSTSVAITGAQSLGTAGFSNITIDNSSYIAISAH